ncbi:MAG TPA: Ku protein [Stellaceae bacterium]|jgi:DNA end-binding protein Ku
MPAAARPYWTGFLKLSLVTISVRLYAAATEKERIHFHMIHQPSGERVRTQTVVPGLGPVERSEIVKGYEYERGRYVTVAPADLEKLRLDTTDTIDIGQFVAADSLDPVHVADPYYLVPDGSLAEAGYRVLREALRRTETVAVGQVVINQRERAVAIRPEGEGLLVSTLRFADEVRPAEPFFAGIGDEPIDPDELAIMEQIIARRTRRFEPDAFVDHYQQALRALIEQKLAGKLPERPTERKPAQVINLMDALKRSLDEESAGAARPASRSAGAIAGGAEAGGAETRTRAAKGRKSPRGAQRSRTQPSLLLPVAGGRAKSAQPARAAASSEAKRRKKA